MKHVRMPSTSHIRSAGEVLLLSALHLSKYGLF